MNRVKALFLLNIIILFTIISSAKTLEIIRDTELEQFTRDIVEILLADSNIEAEDISVYFINSKQVNAFVTGGKNIFINTELIIEAEDTNNPLTFGGAGIVAEDGTMCTDEITIN